MQLMCRAYAPNVDRQTSTEILPSGRGHAYFIYLNYITHSVGGLFKDGML